MKPFASIAALLVTVSMFACSANDNRSGSSDSDLTSGEGESCLLAEPQNFVCGQDYDPVCGCDGKTYSNSCAAARVVTTTTPGECAPKGADAGADAGSCRIPNPKVPEFCAQVYDPVCGCDGETYSNDCEASAHVTSTTPGACP